MITWRVLAVVGLLGEAAVAASAAPLPVNQPGAKTEAERLENLPPLPPAPPGHLDHSGRRQTGRASFYADRFANRYMADGRRMNPRSDVAASKTLPLGSVAKVTNLENGKSETVRIEDRGPYVAGRVVDLSPRVASGLDLKDKGVAPVEVKPITLPAPDGSVRLGAGAAEATPHEVENAVRVTKELTPARAETMKQ